MATATVLKNGPVMVEGGITLLDSNGGSFTMAEGRNVFLCRCGHSASKPFCDGGHKSAGFESEVAA